MGYDHSRARAQFELNQNTYDRSATGDPALDDAAQSGTIEVNIAVTFAEPDQTSAFGSTSSTCWWRVCWLTPVSAAPRRESDSAMLRRRWVMVTVLVRLPLERVAPREVRVDPLWSPSQECLWPEWLSWLLSLLWCSAAVVVPPSR